MLFYLYFISLMLQMSSLVNSIHCISLYLYMYNFHRLGFFGEYLKNTFKELTHTSTQTWSNFCRKFQNFLSTGISVLPRLTSVEVCDKHPQKSVINIRRSPRDCRLTTVEVQVIVDNRGIVDVWTLLGLGFR